ncbi:hypothetical protein CYMTET_35360, partial [Cymbomonas tetramitiformis]
DDEPVFNVTFTSGCIEASPPPLAPPSPPASPASPIPPMPPSVEGDSTWHVYSTINGATQLSNGLADANVTRVVISVNVTLEAGMPTVTHRVLLAGICHTEAASGSAAPDTAELCALDGGQQYQHFRVSGEGAELTVQKLWLRNGFSEVEGGGVYVGNGAVMSAIESVLSDNRVGLEGMPGYGGAVFAEDGAVVVVMATLFLANYAGEMGGALYARRNSSVTILDSNFTGNLATAHRGHGGALCIRDDSSLTVERSRLEGNKAHWAGGALFMKGRSHATISDTRLHYNQVNFDANLIYGGGGYGNGGSIYTEDLCVLNLAHSILTHSQAIYGGGVSLGIGCEGSLLHVLVASSSASRFGGGVTTDSSSTRLLLEHTMVRNCTAWQGGGVQANEEASVLIIHSSLSHNIATPFLDTDSVAQVRSSALS